MKSICVYASARKIGIQNPVACIIDAVSVKDNSNELAGDIDDLMKNLSVNFEKVKCSSEYIGFSKLFESMGYSGQVAAGQRLVEGFLKNGFKNINNVVDAYNIVSARYGCGLGLHDADKVFEKLSSIDIFLASEGDEIVPIFKTKSVKVRGGDLVYGGFSHPRSLIAWLGKKDVDSDEYKVTSDTRSVLLVVTGNSETRYDYNKAICLEVFGLLLKSCPDARFVELETITQCN